MSAAAPFKPTREYSILFARSPCLHALRHRFQVERKGLVAGRDVGFELRSGVVGGWNGFRLGGDLPVGAFDRGIFLGAFTALPDVIRTIFSPGVQPAWVLSYIRRKLPLESVFPSAKRLGGPSKRTMTFGSGRPSSVTLPVTSTSPRSP
jgi:hypothetical protein